MKAQRLTRVNIPFLPVVCQKKKSLLSWIDMALKTIITTISKRIWGLKTYSSLFISISHFEVVFKHRVHDTSNTKWRLYHMGLYLTDCGVSNKQKGERIMKDEKELTLKLNCNTVYIYVTQTIANTLKMGSTFHET